MTRVDHDPSFFDPELETGTLKRSGTRGATPETNQTSKGVSPLSP